MKKNGYLFLMVASLWLFILPSLQSQVSQSKEDLKTQQEKYTSLIEKYPVDLISIPIKHSLNFRNAIKSTSNTIEYQPDSMIFFSGISSREKETFTYDLDGNLITFQKQKYSYGTWTNVELNLYSYDYSGLVLSEQKYIWKDNEWVKNYLFTYTYDLYGNMLTCLLQKNENGHWINYSYYEYTYTVNGKILTCKEQLWQNEQWLNSYVIQNHYDDRNNLDISVRQVWQADQATWINSSRNLSSYDEKGYVLTCQKEFWHDDEWKSNELITNTYNDSENLLTELLQFNYDKMWLNFLLNTSTYDNYGNKTSYTEQFWNGEEWVNMSRKVWTFYLKGAVSTELYQEWTGSWTNSSNVSYVYDEYLNCTNSTWFTWINDSWENYMKVDYDYKDGLISGLGYSWDGLGWESGNAMIYLQLTNEEGVLDFCEWYGSKAEVYYSLFFTGTPEQPVDTESSLTIYPNPANLVLNIDYQTQSTEQTTLQLLDLSGKLIESYAYGNAGSGTLKTELPTSQLAPGVYLLKVNSGTEIFLKKFTVLR